MDKKYGSKNVTEDTKVFYGNICFVCEKTAREVPVKRCASCKLISYCGRVHQKSHWKYHSRLCKLINEIEKVMKPDSVMDDVIWYKYRTNLLMLCELKLEQKLKTYEVNMILFPNNCDVCHKLTNLTPCMSCLCISYCSEEHSRAGFPKHRILCSAYYLCFQLDLKLERTTYFPNYSLRNTNFNLTENIEKFMSENVIVVGNGFTPTMEMAMISDFLSCPLTVLYALSLTHFTFPAEIVIHVTGSSFLETASLESWKAILHVNLTITHMSVVFIGPDVCQNISQDICQDKISFSFFNQHYHEFVKSTDYVKPDVIVSFNCGFHEYRHTARDTWRMSLPLLVSDNKVPFIFTSFTEKEAEIDCALLLEINSSLKMKIMRNKFSGRRPYRDLETSSIYYNNHYFGIVYPELRAS